MNAKQFENAYRIGIYTAGGVNVPFVFSNQLNEIAKTSNDHRFRLAFKHVYTAVLCLTGETREEKKTEYKEILSGLVSNWCDVYYYLLPVEYNEFTRELLKFCAKYARYFGLREYTAEMLPKLNLLYIANKYDAMRALDVYNSYNERK